MKPFTINTIETAPKEAQEILKDAVDNLGLIPNLYGIMSTAPGLLKAYKNSWGLFTETSFSPIEQQIVFQTVNFENNCTYCVPWHSILSEQAGMIPEDIEALRQGSSLKDSKHEALRLFTQSMVRTGGNITPYDLKSFFDAGYGEQQALEVILGISMKVISNFTNNIAQTPLDEPAQSKVWQKPNLKG